MRSAAAAERGPNLMVRRLAGADDTNYSPVAKAIVISGAAPEVQAIAGEMRAFRPSGVLRGIAS
jgi:hypothetical protein